MTGSDEPKYEVWLSLGSNLEPEHHITGAVEDIGRFSIVDKIAPVYRTRPVEMEPDSPDVHNTCIKIQTDYEPGELKSKLQELEASHGRERTGPDKPDLHSSRTMDVDILLYRPMPPEFTPHEQVKSEAFVVFPLSEIVDSTWIDEIPDSTSEWKAQTDKSIILERLVYDWPDDLSGELTV
ncbi:MAG: 2-amino-4-hydroxy-6-hydroxymethyldihydropteridine diphosphokinase [bacterium]